MIMIFEIGKMQYAQSGVNRGLRYWPDRQEYGK